MDISRRTFGTAVLFTAMSPSIVKADSLMRILKPHQFTLAFYSPATKQWLESVYNQPRLTPLRAAEAAADLCEQYRDYEKWGFEYKLKSIDEVTRRFPYRYLPDTQLEYHPRVHTDQPKRKVV